jgi:hypothetical protein
MVMKLATVLSYILAALLAAASAAGILIERIYALEKPIWAAQGIGQDVVNLIIAVPVLVVSAHLARRGSLRALLVWIGALMYLAYSYVVYSFFVHFGPLFPLYIAILSLSFYLLVATILGADLDRVARAFSNDAPIRLTGNLLIGLSGVFYFLWGSDVARSLLAGAAPQSAIDVGFPVNPIHVMDMGLLLPGMALTGLLLRRKRPLGYFMAAPFLVCVITIGLAVMGMVALMILRGFPPAYPAIVAIGTSTILGLLVLHRYLRALGR